MPNIKLAKSFLTVIMHHREYRKTTNSARLAVRSIFESELCLRGLKGAPLDLSLHIKPRHTPLFLTLSSDATELTTELLATLNGPIQLFVPDGNWHQASRVAKREPLLQSAIKVKISPGKPSTYRLRKEHHPEGLSTLEAIARALGVIEGEHVQQTLEQIFDVMVERSLATRPPDRKP